MDVTATVTIPRIFYEIYAAAAKELNCTEEQVLSSALQAYAQHLFEEMREAGELTEGEKKKQKGP